MPPRLRLAVSLLACVLGPALSGIVVGLGMNAIWMATGQSDWGLQSVAHALIAPFLLAVYPVVFGAPLMILIGLPVQAWMARKGITGAVWHVVPAAMVGGLVLLFTMQPGAPFPAAYYAGLGALYGGFAGLFAWLIRRPDRDRRYDAAPQ